MRIVDRRIERELSCSFGTRYVEIMRETAFDTMAEAQQWVSRASMSAENLHRINGDHWLGCVRNPAEYRQMVQSGSPKLRDIMLEMLREIELPDALTRPELTQRRRRTRGEFGNEVDIHRVYQGRCDVAWDKMVTEKVTAHGNRLVHIVIDVGMPAMMNGDCTLWLGAAVMRIYEALTRMGCSVAISMYDASLNLWDREPYHGMVSVMMKNYGQPLREEQLAIACHGAGFRCLLVPLLTIERNTTFNIGYPISDYQLRVVSAEEDEERGGNVITIGKVFNREQAERAIYDFTEQHVFGEIAEGKTTRQLYGYETAEEES